MRFSLATLVMAVAWLAALGLIWVQREPWVLVQRAMTGEEIEGYLGKRNAISPDNTRRIVVPQDEEKLQNFAIVTNSPNAAVEELLWKHEGNAALTWFVNDDAIILEAKDHVDRYHRRRPEWWWGHFSVQRFGWRRC